MEDVEEEEEEEEDAYIIFIGLIEAEIKGNIESFKIILLMQINNMEIHMHLKYIT